VVNVEPGRAHAVVVLDEVRMLGGTSGRADTRVAFLPAAMLPVTVGIAWPAVIVRGSARRPALGTDKAWVELVVPFLDAAVTALERVPGEYDQLERMRGFVPALRAAFEAGIELRGVPSVAENAGRVVAAAIEKAFMAGPVAT
jgi:hypothetical protein